MPYQQFNLNNLLVYPLKNRKSLTQIEDIVVDPDSPPPDPGEYSTLIQKTADKIKIARHQGASVILAYGAHLIRNGASPILIRMMEEGWLTHLATNGAGIIHDWEYSYLGRSTESVRENVATGTFGTWDETGRCINLAAAAGAAENQGLGEAIGRFIWQDGIEIPEKEKLVDSIKNDPTNERIPAHADFLQLIQRFDIPNGKYSINHPWKHYSVPANAYRLSIPFTVHPGIGYDIISNHPYFSPAALGRGAGIDFQRLAHSVNNLSNGVYLSIGSAIMSPQVFEKAMSCANNARLQQHQPIIHNHTIVVVDIQDGEGWDWSQGEPPKTNPAYYLRFCKSFARMGGEMNYLCLDNRTTIHNLYALLK